MKNSTLAIVMVLFDCLIALLIGLSVKKAKNDKQENITTTVAPVDSNDVIRGDKTAQITMIEYSDFQCPYCIKLHPVMKQVVDETYKGQVRWVSRSFPLPFHQAAKGAAIASLAANNQGKFAEYSDILAEKSQADGTGLAATDLTKYASDLGLDMNKFNTDINDPALAAKVAQDTKTGTAAGLEGTPTVYIINKDGKLSGNFSGVLTIDQIKAKIDPLLNNYK